MSHYLHIHTTFLTGLSDQLTFAVTADVFFVCPVALTTTLTKYTEKKKHLKTYLMYAYLLIYRLYLLL